MNPERIESGEVLFRAVQQHPDLWRGDRPSSLLFRNTAGVSVDRDGERSEADICEFIRYNLSVYRLNAVVSVTAAGCQDIGVLAIPKPITSNQFHAEIHESESQVLISKAKARELALHCRIVKSLCD